MDLNRLPREELEGLDRRAVDSDMKKYLENFFEKVSRDLVWWKSLTSVSCIFFNCFIVVAIIAGPPAFDEEQLTDEKSDSDEDDLADLR